MSGAPGSDPADRYTDRAQLVARMESRTRDYRVRWPDAGDSSPLLSGHFSVATLRPGFEIHCVDACDLQDLTIEAELPASLNIVFLVGGRAEARFGSETLAVGERPGQAAAAMIALAEPERFMRQSRRHAYQRKIGVSLTADWLDASGFGDSTSAPAAFRRNHLSKLHWTPSARAVAIVDQLIRPPGFAPGLQNLYLESRTLELVTEAFGRLQAEPPAMSGLSQRDRRRVIQLREWIDSGQAEGLGLQDIARHAAQNAHTLQAKFRAAFGVTIFEYMRGRRLDLARIALENGESISAAAWEAGYTSPANFATAFRRRFGVSPKDVRQQSM